MSVKRPPSTLFNLALQKVSLVLLQQWRETYYTDYRHFSEELKSNIGVIIPYTIYNQIFDCMVDYHARVIQNDIQKSDNVPSIPWLIESILIPNLRSLNFSCLRHVGTVKDEEIRYLETLLVAELPTMNNLVEISLQTSGTDFTLPTCSDEILEIIGNSCPKLRNLDISYNHTVTDKGLEYLIPYDTQKGCPLLVRMIMFECSVTVEGVVMLLQGLPSLKFLGYRETGLVLKLLRQKILSLMHPVNTLELAHVNNLGTACRTSKDMFKLTCDEKLINAICMWCPKLCGLKVRVTDFDVNLLQKIKSLNILELVYNLGTPSSPGSNTLDYLQLCGAQFVSLSFVCDKFNTRFLKVVCEQCINLKRLWIRCNIFICDRDLTIADKKKCRLSNLEVFFFRIGCPRSEICNLPHRVINYVLHKSLFLTELVLCMKNALFCDAYIFELFSSLETHVLKRLMILVPHKNVTLSTFSLSMEIVEKLLHLCPLLEQLGNLLVWDVSLEEIQELRRRLKNSNSALVLVYKLMYS